MRYYILLSIFSSLMFYLGIAMMLAPILNLIYFKEYCHMSIRETSEIFNDIVIYSYVGIAFAIIGIITTQRKLLILNPRKHE